MNLVLRAQQEQLDCFSAHANRRKPKKFFKTFEKFSKFKDFSTHARAFRRTRSLHANSRVNSTSEARRNASSVESQRLEEFAKLLCQLNSRTLLGDHHASPHASQIYVALFQRLNRIT